MAKYQARGFRFMEAAPMKGAISCPLPAPGSVAVAATDCVQSRRKDQSAGFEQSQAE